MNSEQNQVTQPSSNNKRSKSTSPARNSHSEDTRRTLLDRSAKRNIGSYADNQPRLTRTPKGKLIANPNREILESQDLSKRMSEEYH